jgi:hypothetical protein
VRPTVERQERRYAMQVLYQRCAAVDIGKDIIAVAVRLPSEDPADRRTIKRTFKTFYGAQTRRTVADRAVGHACGDGSDQDLFDAGVSRADRARPV